jgi:hypothetical protein
MTELDIKENLLGMAIGGTETALPQLQEQLCPPNERRTLKMLWQEKGSRSPDGSTAVDMPGTDTWLQSDTIVITPQHQFNWTSQDDNQTQNINIDPAKLQNKEQEESRALQIAKHKKE